MNRTEFIPLALALLLLVGLTGGYVLGYRFFLGEQLKATTLETAITSKSAEVENSASAKHALTGLASDEAAISQYFVSESDIVPFLGGLEATGKSLGSDVQVVSVTPDSETGRSHLVLSVSITGSFDAVLRTLGAIEYAPYDIALTSLTLDGQQTGSGKAALWTAETTFLLGTNAATTTKP